MQFVHIFINDLNLIFSAALAPTGRYKSCKIDIKKKQNKQCHSNLPVRRAGRAVVLPVIARGTGAGPKHQQKIYS